jgi:hypothetical protein
LSPGDSSTYVSPSSVFWRRIARVSFGIGAYWWSIASVTFVRALCTSTFFALTLPTVHARDAHVGLHGAGSPPPALRVHAVALRLERDRAAERSHRNSSRPTHESANAPSREAGRRRAAA